MKKNQRHWRIMGRWEHSRKAFLIVVGESAADCRQRLKQALVGYSREDLANIDAAWLEWFCDLGHPHQPRWEAVEEVSLRGVKQSKAIKARRRKVAQGVAHV